MNPTDRIGTMKSYLLKIFVVFAIIGLCSAVTAWSFWVERVGPNTPDRMMVAEFDKNEDGWLNTAERNQARADLVRGGDRDRRGGRRGPGRNRQMTAGKPGHKMEVGDASVYPEAELYDQTVLRTLFLDFDMEDWETDNWEQELAMFKPTDVEIPAKLTVDGKEYPNVGVSFRGASSFFKIPEGLKRSLNLSIDFIDKDQRLYGYKSLNLLNCNGDSSMMSSILYSYLSQQKIAAPKVNFVKVVINGESWGLYVSSQQFNKTFLQENFDSKKGARWKVHGSPMGDGGLRYLGDNIADYRSRFEIKSKDKESSWRDLINLCKVLNETPADQLPQALEPILDIHGALWFLAVDVATSNSDGYWTRASDYNIYQNSEGQFHILPHDMNEAFQAGHGGGGRRGGGRQGRGRFGGPLGGGPLGGGPPQGGGFGGPPQRFGGPPEGGRFGGPPSGFGGPGGGGPPGGFGGPGGGGPGGGPGGHGGVELDPLVGLDTERMPLRSVLLNVPAFRNEYLANLREIAMLMDWKNIGPRVKQYRELIEEEVNRDTRKLFTTKEFKQSTAQSKPGKDSTSLRAFMDKRSAFLLDHPAIKNLEPAYSGTAAEN
jgi:spore coat protein CotH